MTPDNNRPERPIPDQITVDMGGEEKVYINERTLRPPAKPPRPLPKEALSSITIDLEGEEKVWLPGKPKDPPPPSTS
jgi:hypothetical protein